MAYRPYFDYQQGVTIMQWDVKKTSIAVVGAFTPGYKPGTANPLPYKFTVDKFNKSLDTGRVSDELRDEFSNQGIPLNAEATMVEMQVKADQGKNWAIVEAGDESDGDFLIRRVNERLNVFSLPRVAENDNGGSMASEEEFLSACKALGKALADAGHTTVLYVNSWSDNGSENKMCENVWEGIKDSASHLQKMLPPLKPKVLLSVPTGRKYVPPSATENLLYDDWECANVTRKSRPEIRNYYPETFPSVCEADAIILIGGDHFSEMVACTAYYVCQKPVVTITRFGGAAESMYGDIFDEEYENSHTTRFTSDHFILHGSWDTANGKSSQNEPLATEQNPGGGTDEKTLSNEERARRIVDFTEGMIRYKRQTQHAEEKRRKQLRKWTYIYAVAWLVVFCLLISVSATPVDPTAKDQKSESGNSAISASAVGSSGQSSSQGGVQSSEDSESRSSNINQPTPTPIPASLDSGSESGIAVLDGDHDSQWLTTLVGYVERGLRLSLTQNLALWVLLFLSSQMGLQLRTAVSYETGELVDLGTQPREVSSAAALVLSIGLGLIYFIGGWSFSGEVTFPTSKPSAVVSAAFVMSILGLVAGFLMPVEELRSRLGQFIKPGDEMEAT